MSHQIHTYKAQQKNLTSNTWTVMHTDASSVLLESHGIKTICYNKHGLRPGDILHIKKPRFSRPKNQSTLSGNTNFYDYMIRQNIAAVIQYARYKIIGYRWTLGGWLQEKKESLMESLRHKMPKKTFSLFASIFLGHKQSLHPQHKASFRYWGILHHLARSGLHVAIFICIWNVLLSFLPMFLKRLLLLLLCLIYAALSFVSLAFLRALGMLTLYQIGKIARLPTNAFFIVFLVTMATLCFNPIQLCFLDFQLSFSLAIALTLAYT